MNPTLNTTLQELGQLVTSLKAIGSNEPLNVAHGVWNNPGTTRDELVQVVERTTRLIEERGTDQIGSGEVLIADYKRRLEFLRVHTVPQIWSGNAGAAVSVFMITMQGLQDAVAKGLPENQDLAQEIAQARINAKTATNRLRALEARIGDLEPRSMSLDAMVGRIEKANAAADQLPVDLEILSEARKTIEGLLEAVTLDRGKVGGLTTDAGTDKATMSARVKEAEDIVAR